jgi:hypothetical protein
MISLRDMANAIGAALSWNTASKTAAVTIGTKELILETGKTYVLLDGHTVPLSAPVHLENGRLQVPVAFMRLLGAMI